MSCPGCSVEEACNGGSYRAAGSFSGVSGILDGGGSFEMEEEKSRAIHHVSFLPSAKWGSLKLPFLKSSMLLSIRKFKAGVI